MKTYLLASAIAFVWATGQLASATTEIRDFEVVDRQGNTTTCELAGHVGRVGWMMTSPSLVVIGQDKLEASGLVEFVRCGSPRKDGTVEWVKTTPEEKVSRTEYTGRRYDSWHEKMDVSLFNDRFLVLAQYSASNVTELAFKIEIKLSDVLDSTQMTELEGGAEVKARFLFMPRAIEFYQFEGEEAKSLGRRNWGGKYFKFKLQKIDGTLNLTAE